MHHGRKDLVEDEAMSRFGPPVMVLHSSAMRCRSRTLVPPVRPEQIRPEHRGESTDLLATNVLPDSTATNDQCTHFAGAPGTSADPW
jgi:hypothetical protein